MAVSKVGFENPIKPNMQFEQTHVQWIDEQAARFDMGRQGFMRQLMEGLIGYAATKSPKVVEALLKVAGKPLAITRKPAAAELPPPPVVKKRPPVIKELPPPPAPKAKAKREILVPVKPGKAVTKPAAKPTPTKKKGAK